MGKATVLSSKGEGLFSIKVEFEHAWLDARLTAIDNEIAALSVKLSALTPQITAALAKLNTDMAAMDSYISTTSVEQYAADPSAVSALTARAYQSKADYQVLVSEEKQLKLKKTGLEKDKAYLTKNCPKELITDAWCVSWEENLTGTTSTIEVDYMGGTYWLPRSVATPDSKLQYPLATSMHANWFNLCVAPAMQKFKGRYRIALILNIDLSTQSCDLDFDGIYDINESGTEIIGISPILPVINGEQRKSYSGANIDYNLDPFSDYRVGDLVIVDLHLGLGAPTVIGFHDHPRRIRGLRYRQLYGHAPSFFIYDHYSYYNFLTGSYTLPRPLFSYQELNTYYSMITTWAFQPYHLTYDDPRGTWGGLRVVGSFLDGSSNNVSGSWS